MDRSFLWELYVLTNKYVQKQPSRKILYAAQKLYIVPVYYVLCIVLTVYHHRNSDSLSFKLS